jgi:phospholipid/cholesterol/gamma-HCH transport system substrate-binding protein
MTDFMHHRRSRATLAWRGLLLSTMLLAGGVTAVAYGSDAFTDDPTVTSVVPASAGLIRDQASVQYRGVVVGKLVGIEAGTEDSRLVMRMDPGQLNLIPGNAQVRVLPRTLFGDQYIDLVAAPGPNGPPLAPGTQLRADTSTQTAQLYATFRRLHSLLTAMRPAQLQVALSALADALRGRGERLGRTIDQLHAASAAAVPTVDAVLASMPELKSTVDTLSTMTPDLTATLENTLALSQLVVEKQRNIAALLSAGTDLVGRSQRLLLDNRDRVIQLVRNTGPLSEALGANAGNVGALLNNLSEFLDKGNRVFATGRFEIRAGASIVDPYPYTAEDCPRYPGLDGPNCDDAQPVPSPLPIGGTAGPVGSTQEMEALRRLLPLLPGQPTTADPHLFGLLLGPLVRGAQVITP